MIAPRGATPCNLMLSEVGRAHVATAIPIVYQPPEVFKVWAAVSSYLRGALLSGVNVSIFRRTLSFSCSKRKTFKKIPAGFHRDSQTFDLRVPLFGVSNSFATTYSLDSPLVEDQSLTYTQLPAKVISEAAKVPVAVVNAVLHDIMRFVGEGLYQGRLLEIDFPGVAHVRTKRDRVMAVFDDEFTAELLNIDTRKWPAVYAREAKELLLKKNNNNNTIGNNNKPTSARPSSARPNSARSSKAAASSSPFNPPPFVNAPTPVGRTFDEMQELRQNDATRKKRRSQSLQNQRAATYQDPNATNADGSDNNNNNNSKSPEFDNNLAVVYDESVPASQLSPAKINGKSSSRAREESVYDMVMPSANNTSNVPAPQTKTNNNHAVVVQTADQNGNTVIMNNNNNNMMMSSTLATHPPTATMSQPPYPQPRPNSTSSGFVKNTNTYYYQQQNNNNKQNEQQPPVSSQALSSERPRTGRRLGNRSIYTNSHISIFGVRVQDENAENNAGDSNNNGTDESLEKHANPPHLLTGKRRYTDRNQNQPTTVLGGAKDPINARIQRDMPEEQQQEKK